MVADQSITPAKLSQPLTLGTAQNTTSGTAIDFTGIPSWAKRITVMLSGVSTNGTSPPQLQVGSGSVQTSGYSNGNSVIGAAAVVSSNFTNAFGIGVNLSNWSAANVASGALVLTLVNAATNTWVCHGVIGLSSAATTYITGGSVSLSGALDRLRLSTFNGTDAFDAGSVNILYE